MPVKNYTIEMESETLLRVIISDNNIRKLRVSNIVNVQQLKDIIKASFKLEYDFIIQYFDRDFQDYFNLDSIADLKDMGTIKLLGQESSINLADSPQTSTLPGSDSHTISSKPWPGTFPLPNFSQNPYIQSHLDTMSKNEVSFIPETLKRKIVAVVVDEIMKFSYYPNGKDIENLCRKLVETYPMLRDQGPGGYTTWCACVKFRVSNVRRTLKNTVPEVGCNSGKRSRNNPLAPSPHSGIKKVRTGIIMVPQNCLNNENLDSLRDNIKREALKSQPDLTEVSQNHCCSSVILIYNNKVKAYLRYIM